MMTKDFEIDQYDFIFENTALILAAAKDRDESVKLMEKLIELDANPNIQNENGHSVLDIAVVRRDLEMINAILKSPLIEDVVIKKSLEILDKDSAQNKKIVRDAICMRAGKYEDCLNLSKEINDEVLQDDELKDNVQSLLQSALAQDKSLRLEVQKEYLQPSKSPAEARIKAHNKKSHCTIL